MTIMKILFTILIWVFLSVLAKSDSWEDPDWNEMIDSSDAIALIEYINDGDFLVQAKVLKLYRGQLNSDTIWISGFSNRYGPIDKMSPGDKYIVFLNFNSPTENSIEYWGKLIIEKPEYSDYFEDMKKGKAYYVPSPTSGDLRVKDSLVQYDLNRTTYYREQPFYPIEEFEKFLYANSEKNKEDFYSQTLKKIESNTANRSQHLMMLYLTHFDSFDSIFNQIVDENNPEECYALARLLGQVKEEKALEVLVKLLDNQNSIVQGEAVRQLSNQDPEFIGPILLARLSTAVDGGIYPTNIMDPVMNEMGGGKIEIMRALGKLDYKPATPILLEMLRDDDDDLFSITIRVLKDLDVEGTKLAPYLNYHLEKLNGSILLNICFLIRDYSLKECLPSLMYYIKEHDKAKHPSREISLSTLVELADLDRERIEKFIIDDFNSIDELESGWVIDNRMDWFDAYMSAFMELQIDDTKELAYNFMYHYYGFDYRFRANKEIFDKKKHMEDSLKSKISTIIDLDRFKSFRIIAFLNKTDESILDDYSIELYVENSDITNYLFTDEFNDIYNSLELNGITKGHVRIRNQSNIRSDGAKELKSLDYMTQFLSYLISFPEKEDIIFIKNLVKYYDFNNKSEERLLNRIKKIE